MHGAGHIRLARRGRIDTDAQRIRVGELGAQRLVAADLLQDIEQARHRTARGATAHRLDAQPDARERRAEASLRLALQHMHTEVGGDGIEAAAVHDARAARFRGGLVTRHHAPDPLHLTGEVAVVRTGLGAGLHERFAVERVRADRGDHHPRAAAHRAHRVLIGGIGDDHGQRRGSGSERGFELVELGARAPGDGPAQRAARPARPLDAELLDHAVREDLAHEARGAEDDDVVHGPLPGQDQKLLSAVALPSAPNQTQPLPSMAPSSRTNM